MAWYAWNVMPLAVLGFALVAWLALGVFREWAERVRLFRWDIVESWRRATGLPRASYGMSMAHLGVALTVFGITASEAWQEEKQVIMRPGDVQTVSDFELTFVGAEQLPGPNYSALAGTFAVTRNGQPVTILQPEARTFTNPPMETTEAAIRTTLAGDLYTVVGEGDGQGGYAVRLYYKPMVIWIWLGTLAMMIGGMISLSDRRHRIGAPARKQGETADTDRDSGALAAAGAGD